MWRGVAPAAAERPLRRIALPVASILGPPPFPTPGLQELESRVCCEGRIEWWTARTPVTELASSCCERTHKTHKHTNVHV